MKKNFFTPAQAGSTTREAQIFTPAESAKRCACHANSVKRIADDLKITPLRTKSGLRIYNLEQITRIAHELARRRKEALR